MHRTFAPIGLALSISALLAACGGRVVVEGSDPGGTGGIGGAGGGPFCNQSPAPLTSDVLDPDHVYLAGTLAEGSCSGFALAHWSSPNSAVVGFDCYFNGTSAQIRPTDGRLLYLNLSEAVLREFHCDGCPYGGGNYPKSPLANDTILPTSPCDPAVLYSLQFLVSPAGTVLHHCSPSSATWYDENGSAVYADMQAPLLHLGHGDLALTKNSVVHLASASSQPIVGLPDRTIYTVRAKAPDSFLLVLATEQNPLDESGQELWEVDAKGVATMLGTFPPLPAGAKRVLPFTSKLEVCGSLVQFGFGTADFEDIIVRREIGGASDLVYTAASDPLVKIGLPMFVTGP